MDTKEISKIVGRLTYDLRTNMTSVTRFVKMKRENHPTLTDGQFLDRYLEYHKLALQAVDNILKCLNENEELKVIENIYFENIRKKNDESKNEIKKLIPGPCFHGEIWYQCPHCKKGIEAHEIKDTEDNIHTCFYCGGKFYYKR